jgi:hypothetical protein
MLKKTRRATGVVCPAESHAAYLKRGLWKVAVAIGLWGLIGSGMAIAEGLPGDVALFPRQVKCMRHYAANPKNNYKNYWPAIGAPEHTDSIHDGPNPCAVFTGSLREANEVNQFVSLSTYTEGIGLIVFDGPKGAYLMAQQQCGKYGPNPNTTFVAVDPDTLKTIDAILLNQDIVARPIVTRHKGRIYIYMAGTTTLVRVIWDPAQKKLTQDSSWAPSYLLPGQAAGDAPALNGNWVVANTNGAAGSVPMSVVAVNQNDPNKLVRINPWGTTLPAGVLASESPGSFGSDPKTNMIYAQDYFVGGVFGIKIDQATGAMTVAWSRPDWRCSDYFSLVGPPDKRVILSQYINPSVGFDGAEQCAAGNTAASCTYTESVLWADAATGTTLAQSDYNPSTFLGSLPNLGYGGRVYMMGYDGLIYIYEPVP